jgi:hypothetical protein
MTIANYRVPIFQHGVISDYAVFCLFYGCTERLYMQTFNPVEVSFYHDD